MAIINQTLGPLWVGEDVSYALALTAQGDPSAWAIKAVFQPKTGQAATLTTGGSTVSVGSVSGSGTAWNATVTITINSAKTSVMGPGDGKWQCWRTDSNSLTLLGEGTYQVLTPKIPLV